jgi:hypothetical protein
VRAIEAGNHLLNFVVFGAILGAWQELESRTLVTGSQVVLASALPVSAGRSRAEALRMSMGSMA